MRYLLIPILMCLLFSCKKEDAIPSKCETNESLEQYSQYFVGLVNDTIKFVKEDSSETYFVIREKTFKENISQQDCRCDDLTVFLSNASDSIFMNYYNVNKAYYENAMSKPGKLSFSFKVDNEYSSMVFTASDPMPIRIGDLVFNDLIIFVSPTLESENKQFFKKVIWAKKHGIIRMEKHNGEVLTAKNLGENLIFGLNSFESEQFTCD